MLESSISTLVEPARIEARARVLDEEYTLANRRDTSQIFGVLMVVQWVFGVAFAACWSPFTWSGATRTIHPHIYVAVFLGAALSSIPFFLTTSRPADPLTPWVVTVAQMLWSALLIHVSGGRIETHFHVFGSLAFVAFYRDWRLLIPATLTVAADYLLRGVLWPESVYGVPNPEWWRFIEHAAWVVFEDSVLAMACIRGVREAYLLSRRQAEAEVSLEAVSDLNASLDRRVQERTEQLEMSNGELKDSVERLNKTQRELVDASRRAGMADVATAVLHNVGNVLNSVNVSTNLLLEQVRGSKSTKLARLTGLLDQDDVASALATHPKTLRVPAYLKALDTELGQERTAAITELEGLQRNVDHIKTIVAMQQSHAKRAGGVIENLNLAELTEEVIRLNASSLTSHRIQVIRQFDELPRVMVDRHAVLQILLNLVRNAQQAIGSTDRGEGKIVLSLRQSAGFARLEVQDSGCGISPENLARVFNHGFTTKDDGHGFGLHSSANAAKEMGGQLVCSSPGPGLGATFSLDIPLQRSPLPLAA